MERYFSAHRLKWRTAMEMSSNESIKQAVIAGLGLGFLSLQTVRIELAAGRIVALDVEGLPIERQWYAVRRASRRLVPAAEEFGEFLVREASALLDSEGRLPIASRKPKPKAPYRGPPRAKARGAEISASRQKARPGASAGKAGKPAPRRPPKGR